MTIQTMEVLETLQAIEQDLMQCNPLSVDRLNNSNTAIAVVDVIEGFIHEGPLASERLRHIVDPIVHLLDQTDAAIHLFFMDHHRADAEEFEAFPSHCVAGSREADLVPALQPYADAPSAKVILKNSTNGFVSHGFLDWLETRPDLTRFVIVGDCTDLCVKQLALTLKAYFHEVNVMSDIIVPMNMVETYHLDQTHHHGDLMHLLSLYEMKLNGVHVVSSID